MKVFIFFLLAFFALNTSASTFANTCLKMNPDNEFLGQKNGIKSLQRCMFEGYASYQVSDLQKLEIACLKEGNNKRLTVAAVVTRIDGKRMPKLNIMCWPDFQL